MAEPLTLEQAQEILRAEGPLDDQFELLQTASYHTSFATDRMHKAAARDLVIHLLERRNEFNGYREVVDSLALSIGLYPYVDTGSLSASEIIEYEAHRPDGMSDIVFHRVQASVYNALMDGESVILTAPTSFGKSLIIDGLLASGRFNNVAVVVPTIALIDETRRRLSERFRRSYKIVTHPHQDLSHRNVLIMTQERILDVEELPPLDLFVIDEFYKLDPTNDPDRANLLNQAFHRLKGSGAPFYLLGPNVGRLPIELNVLARVIETDFSTVALDIRRVPTSGTEDFRSLITLCRGLEEPTLVFCKSPAQARRVAKRLVAAGVGSQGQMQLEADWIADQYHPDWSFVRGLRQGIGIHHGRIPRSLSQLAVRAFNDGRLRFLVVTSTLIEGVNTTAKNVVIFDNKIASRRYDYFTFNNIKGRSGRMFNHFVGHVYLFHETPEETLRDIDVPILTQPEDAAPSLLIQLDEEELSQRSLETLSDILSQDDLPIEDLREGGGVEPQIMIEVARQLRSSAALRRQLSWRGLPSYEQLQKTCEVIWEDLGGKSSRGSYVRTHGQLAYRLNRLRIDGIKGLIDAALEEEESPDQAVEDVLDFVRQWAGFHFPRLLMVLERIYNRVATSIGTQQASYGYFATQVESLFRPKSLVALEEYGLPIQIGDRIHEAINLDVPLDEALEKLRQVKPGAIKLQKFEREILRDVQQYI